MTGRERIIKTLKFEPVDRIPHFESMFQLEYEAFGLRFPDIEDWDNLKGKSRKDAIKHCMNIYEAIFRRFEWDALAVYFPWSDPEGVRMAKERFGSEKLIGGMCGNSIWAIENITDWMQFSVDLIEAPEKIHEEAREKYDRAIEKINAYKEIGADFVFLPNDIAYNAGPFIRPDQLREFVFPYWKREVEAVKSAGMYAFIHTDGQITPILDDLLDLGAHCLQSLDPMAGVDIGEVKKKTHKRLALMGNVQCSLLQDGPKELIKESAEYCLEKGSPGGGYIYSSSNTIMPGLPLENYEYMLKVYNDFNETV
ncbi:MAG: uroporphyrinogen decarboxylase family protein [Spirochaetia bacterium]